jgi:hypothetical protein
VNESGQRSPYQNFVDQHDRLLQRPPDFSVVSLLGQEVCNILDAGCSDVDMQNAIAKLEADRTAATEEKIDPAWVLPLTGLLGVLNQNMANRAVGAASFNPNSPTLRDKVLAAIDAGICTAATIAPDVQSPSGIVLQVLHKLYKEGQIKLKDAAEDEYQRSFLRIHEAEREKPSGPVRAAPNEADKRSGGPEKYG